MNQLLTPCIVQTIIICCTIIIIALIVLLGYRINKNKDTDKEILSARYIFISSILVVLAIVIFSYAFYGNRTVLDFISLASALISIILAIITIIYSFYTNGRSVGQAEKLQKSAEEVQEATKAYSESAKSLQGNIQKILDKIDHVEENTNAICNNIYEISDRSNIPDEKRQDSESPIEQFVILSSKLGLMALYAGILAKDNNKKFPLLIFGQIKDQSYCSGFLIAASCMNFIEVKLQVEDKHLGLCLYVDKYEFQLKQKVYQKIKYFLTNAEDKEFCMSTKKKIDQYFCKD